MKRLLLAALAALLVGPAWAGPTPLFDSVTIGGTLVNGVGSATGNVASGPALATETTRATAAESTNATAIQGVITSIANEVVRAQLAEGKAIQAPLTGDVTTSGVASATTLAPSGVAAGVYGSGTTIPVLTVDAKGRVTSASSTGVSSTAGGTVSSVALSLPPIFAVTGSPVTATGTLTGALATEAVNSVWAGPSSGSAAAPSFRALQLSDLPTSAAQAANLVLAGPASGSNAVPSYRALVPSDEPAPADGCVRLSVTSTTVLTLNPYGCNTLNIGGVSRVVTPITISNSGLAASTLYYVYDTTAGLVLSATGHVTGSDGREYLSNSGTANTADRLVGMIETNASSQFQDAVSFRGCLNWFAPSRRVLSFQGPSTAGGSIVAGSGANNAGYAATVLSWSDEAISSSVIGGGTTGSANALLTTSVYVDGTNYGAASQAQIPTAGGYGPTMNSWVGTFSEGVHIITPGVSVNSGGANITSQVVGSIRG